MFCLFENSKLCYARFRCALCSMSVRATTTKKEKHRFCIDGSLCYFQVHTALGGILPGEEIKHLISRGSASSANNSPSGKPSTGMRCAGRIFANPRTVRLFIHLCATAIPRALRGEVCEPLAPIPFLQICAFYFSASGFGFVRSTNKKK